MPRLRSTEKLLLCALGQISGGVVGRTNTRDRSAGWGRLSAWTQGLGFGHLGVKYLWFTQMALFTWKVLKRAMRGSGLRVRQGSQTPAETMEMGKLSPPLEIVGRIQVWTSPYGPPRPLPLAWSLQVYSLLLTV